MGGAVEATPFLCQKKLPRLMRHIENREASKEEECAGTLQAQQHGDGCAPVQPFVRRTMVTAPTLRRDSSLSRALLVPALAGLFTPDRVPVAAAAPDGRPALDPARSYPARLAICASLLGNFLC